MNSFDIFKTINIKLISEELFDKYLTKAFKVDEEGDHFG